MKTKFSIALFTFLSLVGFSQTGIIGNWQSEEKTGVVEIGIGTDGTYYGKLIEVKSEKTFDDKNPDVAKRNQPLKDLVIMKGFHLENASLLSGGTIYDPKNGKTYNCKMTLKDNNTLIIRGFIGASWMGLGRTSTWSRYLKS